MFSSPLPSISEAENPDFDLNNEYAIYRRASPGIMLLYVTNNIWLFYKKYYNLDLVQKIFRCNADYTTVLVHHECYKLLVNTLHSEYEFLV